MYRLSDGYSRKIDYLRVSVTDRCNLRCSYCMPPQGIKLHHKDKLLTLEETKRAVAILSDMGISKVRLTGGEPLLRENILILAEGIKNIEKIEDISLTTNGMLLKKYAKNLYRLGIRRLNISIDSLNQEKYRTITRGSRLDSVLQAVDDSIGMGFCPIKINTVITPLFDLDDAARFMNMAESMPVHIRFIEMMPVPGTNNIECSINTAPSSPPGIAIRDIISFMNPLGYKPLEEQLGFGPAVYYKKEGDKGSIGFIENRRDTCSYCNRIRLTCRGTLKTCLFSSEELDIKKDLQNSDDAAVQEKIAAFIKSKPLDRDCSSRGRPHLFESMNRIGG